MFTIETRLRASSQPLSYSHKRCLCLFAIASLGTIVSCSSKDDDASGDKKENTDEVPINSIVIPSEDNTTTNTDGTGTQKGGTVVITDDQISAILDAQCTGTSAEIESIPAVLQLVVDTSLSMTDPAPGGGGTKWDVTRNALLSALDALPNALPVGLQNYPNSAALLAMGSNPGCVSETGQVPIAPLGPAGGPQRTALANHLNSLELLLGTPTHDAYSFAKESGVDVYQGVGERFMLLITDGAPTQLKGCGELLGDQAVDTDPIINSIAAAASEGIRTFLIGSPGSEQGRAGDMRRWLSLASVLGGTALEGCNVNGPDFCHFDMTQATNFSVALAEGLGAITSEVANSCTFEIPNSDKSINPELTNVIIEWSDETSVLALHDNEGECDEGWSWNDEDELVLCGATCNDVKADALARVHVSFGCDSETISAIIK